MVRYVAGLKIDFGEVGYRNSSEPFRVRLDARPLMTLIADAKRAYRVYELMLMGRPGDVWDYVHVTAEAIPARVADRIASAREKATPLYGPHPWPDGAVPFNDFDRMFSYHGDDTEPEDEAWLRHRTGAAMRAYARQLLAIADQAKELLGFGDPLIAHELKRIRVGTHDFDQLERRAAVAQARREPPREEVRHTPEFYKKLDELLQDPEIASVAYRGVGDYRVLRSVATIQRSRADRTGHQLGRALEITASVGHEINNQAWDSHIWFYMEGLGHGDLFIDEATTSNIKAFVEVHRRVNARYILACKDEGEIAGYSTESGDGWTLYRRNNPVPRRIALRWLRYALDGSREPVLMLDADSAWVYAFDFAAVVVGESVDAEARDALAASIADWQAAGGKPVVLVLGDTMPFTAAGCRNLLIPPSDTARQAIEAARADWWTTILQERCRWVDVVLALDPPDWVKAPLVKHVRRQERPWPPWVAASPGSAEVKADFALQGDLAALFTDARVRARAHGSPAS
jgi:hypothetical protein